MIDPREKEIEDISHRQSQKQKNQRKRKKLSLSLFGDVLYNALGCCC
jgi:uncharacterized protein YggL (DUF469 family)